MKVGLFSPYLDTLGGGERYFLTAAEFFLKRRDKVDIFWNGERDVSKIKDRFKLELEGANFIDDIFFAKGNRIKKLLATAKYDLIFSFSDGSIPFLLSKRSILHFQRPFSFEKIGILDKLKLKKITHVVCNSEFTKKYIDKSFGVNSLVIYPPVDVESFTSGKKENIILGVGRFFGPQHPKKQEVMVETFKKMKSNWQLVLIGGVTGEESIKAVEHLKNTTRGSKIKIITDSSFETLKKYYAKAKLFWHAAGYGENLDLFPERAEHFGMTTVEAMSAGCVPLAFSGGGQKEIIIDGDDGYLWKTLSELVNKTSDLIDNDKKREKMAQVAIQKSREFSKEEFFKTLDSLL